MLRTTNAHMYRNEPHRLSDYEYRPLARYTFMEMLSASVMSPYDPDIESADILMAYETYNL